MAAPDLALVCVEISSVSAGMSDQVLGYEVVSVPRTHTQQEVAFDSRLREFCVKF